MPATTLREALLRVTALIEGGWVKGRDHKTRYGRDCYCLRGALNRLREEGSFVRREIVATAISEAISRLHPKFPVYDGIVAFNDAKGRKKSEVLAVLRDAAERAKL